MGKKKVVSTYYDIPDNRPWIRKHGKSVLLVILGAIFGQFTYDYFQNLGTNEIGLTLVNNGLLIFMASFIMVIASLIEKSKLDVVWENLHVEKPSYLLFKLLEKSYGIIFIKSIKGTTECELGEFFPVKDDNIITRLYYSEIIEEKKLLTSPVIELPSGEYHISIKCEKAILSFGYLFYYKPYEILFSIGLTVAEIGVPILISGLILLLYNASF